MIIFMRPPDNTIEGCWLHPEADLEYMEQELQVQRETGASCNSWVSIYREKINPFVPNYFGQTIVRHIDHDRKKIEDLIEKDGEIFSRDL